VNLGPAGSGSVRGRRIPHPRHPAGWPSQEPQRPPARLISRGLGVDSRHQDSI